MNPPPLGTSNNLSRSGTPNMKSGGMQSARAQQNHTPNQPLMHSNSLPSGNSDSINTSLSSQSSYTGMPPSIPSGFQSNYPGYDIDTGQMSYGPTTMHNSIHSSQNHNSSLQRCVATVTISF